MIGGTIDLGNIFEASSGDGTVNPADLIIHPVNEIAGSSSIAESSSGDEVLDRVQRQRYKNSKSNLFSNKHSVDCILSDAQAKELCDRYSRSGDEIYSVQILKNGKSRLINPAGRGYPLASSHLIDILKNTRN